MDVLSKVPLTLLPRPLDGPPWLELGLSGQTGCFAGWLKPPEDSLPRPYQDPYAMLPIQCGSRSLITMGGRLREISDEWMGITQNPFLLGTIEGNLLQLNQKPP